MGIFTRLADIINSNLNAILDRAEDPEKLIRLIIQEMEDTLVEVRSAAVKAIAEKKEVERRLSRLAEEREEWQRRAELALGRDRDDLARGALAAKAKLADTVKALEDQRAQLEDALARQNEDIGKLQAKLADAKSREKALVARHATAARQLKMRAHIHDDRITDAFARFEQVERTLDEMEGKVESYDLGRRRSLADEFVDLEAEASVESELAELKGRLKPGKGRE